MPDLIVDGHNASVQGSIELEGSKSLSNRLLIMQAMADEKLELRGLSPSDDTEALQRILKSKSSAGNVGAAGTTMRFLTAFYAAHPGDQVLTGSARMLQRPIGILVDALRALGAVINYAGEEGYPPLHIRGSKLRGGKLSIRADVSSQYISALLMVAPEMENGLELELTGKVGSFPYIRMTLELMSMLGIRYSIDRQVIRVEPGKYHGGIVQVEGDWSAASYYFGLCALADDPQVDIHGLFSRSLQGDSVLPAIYAQLGVVTTWDGDVCRLTKTGNTVNYFEYDFSDCPDLAQTVVVTCAALGIPGSFSGLESLRIKETDRTAALAAELGKFGVQFTQDGDSWKLEGTCERKEGVHIATYDDHRMAMAFAPLALLQPIIIEDSRVVAKSYPSFWDDLSILGVSSSPA